MKKSQIRAMWAKRHARARAKAKKTGLSAIRAGEQRGYKAVRRYFG